MFLAASVLVLSSCAVIPSQSPEERVAARAQARVDFLMAADWEAAYAFATPGYRSTENVGRYGTRWSGANMWKAAEIKQVDCEAPPGGDPGEAQVCNVVMSVTYKAVGYGDIDAILHERWLLLDREWYLYQDLSV